MGTLVLFLILGEMLSTFTIEGKACCGFVIYSFYYVELSAFFMVQLSHPYMTTGKTIALTRQTFVGKVMPLLFNMLPRLVITFLPRSKRLLIS